MRACIKQDLVVMLISHSSQGCLKCYSLSSTMCTPNQGLNLTIRGRCTRVTLLYFLTYSLTWCTLSWPSSRNINLIPTLRLKFTSTIDCLMASIQANKTFGILSEHIFPSFYILHHCVVSPQKCPSPKQNRHFFHLVVTRKLIVPRSEHGLGRPSDDAPLPSNSFHAPLAATTKAKLSLTETSFSSIAISLSMSHSIWSSSTFPLNLCSSSFYSLMLIFFSCELMEEDDSKETKLSWEVLEVVLVVSLFFLTHQKIAGS